MITLCENCANVESVSRKYSPTQWLCTRFPRIEGMGFVAPHIWAQKEPFMKCRDINGGACPLFEQLKTRQEAFNQIDDEITL